MQPFQHLNNRQLAISNWRWVRGRPGPLTDNRLPATAVDDRRELLGVGGDALKKLEFLKAAARPPGRGRGGGRRKYPPAPQSLRRPAGQCRATTPRRPP